MDGVIVLSKFTSKGGSLSCCVTEYHQGISSAPLASGWRGYFVALWRVSRGNKSQTFFVSCRTASRWTSADKRRGSPGATGSDSALKSPTHLKLGLVKRSCLDPEDWIISSISTPMRRVLIVLLGADECPQF